MKETNVEWWTLDTGPGHTCRQVRPWNRKFSGPDLEITHLETRFSSSETPLDQETQIFKFALISWSSSTNCWNLLSLLVSQGGVYHGRILVPADYPMKPPDIIVLTPNGRFSEMFHKFFQHPLDWFAGLKLEKRFVSQSLVITQRLGRWAELCWAKCWWFC